MAFSNPTVVTVNAVAQNLFKVGNPSPFSTLYSKDDGSYKLTPSHSYGKSRTRRSVRLDHTKIAADPFLPAANVKFSSSIYLVIDEPLTGYSRIELKQQVDAFLAALSASSGLMISDLLAGQN